MLAKQKGGENMAGEEEEGGASEEKGVWDQMGKARPRNLDLM